VALGVRALQGPPPEHVYRAGGLPRVPQHRLHGRVGIYEIMTMTREVKHLIQDKTDILAVTQAAYKAGMRPLRVSGAVKVANGMTTWRKC
jgi:general secretion pathway protein E